FLLQYKDYLNEDEMKKIMDLNVKNMSEGDIREWMKVVYDIKSNLHIDPASEQAQKLVENWVNQADKMFENDEELMDHMLDALQNFKEGIAFYPMNKEVIQFIESVLTAKEELKK